jgi:hypothetical protein
MKKEVIGYSKYQEFFSPMYSADNLKDKQPDLRTLLFWKPDVVTLNGSVKLQFFSSDLTGKYKVFVEGIANDGKICIGSGEFEVM